MAGGSRRGHVWAAVGVFLAVFAVYQQSRIVNSFDSLWSIHAALSLWRRGDLDLEEYRAVIPPDDYRVADVNGRLVSIFPVGTLILAAPLVGLYDLAYRAQGVDLDADLRTPNGRRRATRIEKTVACLMVAAAAVVIFAIGLARLPLGGALLLAAIFAFCTPAWSLASRGLWQHGPTMLLLTVALYLFVVAERRPGVVVAAAVPLAFAFVVRPTNAIPLVAFSVLVALRHRRRLLPFLAVVAAVLVPLVAHSLAVYGSPLPPYYAPSRLSLGRPFLAALAANLISPARGLLVFSPVLAFAAWGGWRRARSAAWTALDSTLASSIVALWLVVSSFPHWWGGHCYGPRFLSDGVPFLVWFLIPALAALAPGGQWQRRWSVVAVAGLFALAVAVSAAIHFRGAQVRATVEWDGTPADVDEQPERVWDWRDPPFLRGIG